MLWNEGEQFRPRVKAKQKQNMNLIEIEKLPVEYVKKVLARHAAYLAASARRGETLSQHPAYGNAETPMEHLQGQSRVWEANAEE